MRRKFILLTIALLVLIQGAVGVLAQDSQVKTLYELVAEKAVRDDQPSEFVEGEQGIDFQESSSEKNGKGVYVIASTLKDSYPIYYYRGEVDNNHVLLEGNCYLIVRTTDTGGIKMMYDGKVNKDGTCVNTVFDSSLLHHYGEDYDEDNSYMGEKDKTKYFYWDTWEKDYSNFSGVRLDWKAFSAVEKSGYSANRYPEYKYADKITFQNGKYYLENAQSYKSMSDTTLKNKYTCLSEEDSCETIYHIESDGLTYVTYTVYKNGDTYEKTIADLLNKHIILGNDVKYTNGKYTLLDTVTYPIESLDSFEDILKESNIGKRHYIGISDGNTCTTVYYIYDLENSYGTYVSYIEFRNGETLETALKDVYTYYKKYENPSNSRNSEQKSMVDAWYQRNMATYTNLLEDTIWCDDRTVDYGNLDKNVIFKATSYGTSINYLFSTYKRILTGTPTLQCSRKVDSFTVNNQKGNQKLKYPVGLLTADEMIYMGTTRQSWCSHYSDVSMSTVYPNSMYEQKIPFKDWNITRDTVKTIENGISPISDCIPNSAILPVISVKNTEICGGTGTEEDPYRIGYSACGLEAPVPNLVVPNTSDNILKYGVLFVFSIFLGSTSWFMRKRTMEKRG